MFEYDTLGEYVKLEDMMHYEIFGKSEENKSYKNNYQRFRLDKNSFTSNMSEVFQKHNKSVIKNKLFKQQ